MSDAWHALEVEWQAASGAGANNGLLRLWLDGSPVNEQTGLEDDTGGWGRRCSGLWGDRQTFEGIILPSCDSE